MTSNTGSGGKEQQPRGRDVGEADARARKARGDVAPRSAPGEERDALGRPLRSSLSDTDQSGTGQHDKWIGPSQGDHMRLHGPGLRRTVRYTQAELDLKASVEHDLGREHRIDNSEIYVGVDDTEVTLTGSVPHRGMRNLAENVAQAVKRVSRVDNQLKVHEDADAAAAANDDKDGRDERLV